MAKFLHVSQTSPGDCGAREWRRVKSENSHASRSKCTQPQTATIRLCDGVCSVIDPIRSDGVGVENLLG